MATLKIHLNDKANTLIEERHSNIIPRPGELIHLKCYDGYAVHKITDVVHPISDSFDNIIICVKPTDLISEPPKKQAELAANTTSPSEETKKIFEQAKNYNNVITLAGYAGIFAIWNMIKSDMDKITSGKIALLVGMSLVLFVAFEIIGMIGRTLIISHADVENSKIERIGRFIESAQHRLWAIFVIATIAPALWAVWILFSFAFNKMAFPP